MGRSHQIFLLKNPHEPITSFADMLERTKLLYVHDKIYANWLFGTKALNAYQIEWEIRPDMARNASAFSDWRFVNLNLSTADQKQFGEWFIANETAILPMLAEVVADTYKFSVSYDFDNECFIAALSATKHSSDNKQCTITARSNEWLEAIALLLYKHVVMCNTGTWEDYARPANWG